MSTKPSSPGRSRDDYYDMSHSLLLNHLQTEVKKSKHKTKFVRITEYLTKRGFSWVYYYIVNRFGCNHPFVSYPKSMNGIYKIGPKDNVNICIAADWATNTEESDSVATAIKALKPDYTIHLGDTYYVGAPHEIGVNFTYKNASWAKGSKGSFALIGNHEMYARGIAFYKKLLPTMGIFKDGKYSGQKAGYFCLENEHWRILGLDTGYHSTGKIPIIENIPWFAPDCHFDEKLVEWLKTDVRLGDPEDKRGLVILTHHQFVTAFKNEGEYVKPAQQLAELIGRERAVVWIFGHEHKFSMYEKVQIKDGVTAYGRCIGHGGMPIEVESQTFKRSKSKLGYHKLVMVDERSRIGEFPCLLGYNGFANLSLYNEELRISYYDVNNKLLTETWQVDADNGTIQGAIEVFSQALNHEKGKKWADAVK